LSVVCHTNNYNFILSFCFSMDSTLITGDGLGRFVNDIEASKANCKMRIVEIDKVPHLGLFATKTIFADEELRYDYGVSDLPWRTKVNF